MKSWKCEICEYENEEQNAICKNCGAYREESSYDAYADEQDEKEGF